MIFDNNVLNIICIFIDDPKTFRNFAIACRKTNYITNLQVDDKMTLFSEKQVVDYHGISIIHRDVKRKLPNGNLHGKQLCSDFYVDMYSLYYNGIHLAEWYYEEYDNWIDCYVTHRKCNCTKDFPNSYTIEKIKLKNYHLISKNDKKYNCEKCGSCKKEVECWTLKNVTY